MDAGEKPEKFPYANICQFFICAVNLHTMNLCTICWVVHCVSKTTWASLVRTGDAAGEERIEEKGFGRPQTIIHPSKRLKSNKILCHRFVASNCTRTHSPTIVSSLEWMKQQIKHSLSSTVPKSCGSGFWVGKFEQRKLARNNQKS